MNTKRFVMAGVAAFIFTFLFDWAFHGTILMDMYAQTADVWRPMEEMELYHQWMLLTQILISLVITYIFVQNYEAKGIQEGVRFGVMIGLLIGVLQFGSYGYLPIPMDLAVFWLLGSVVYGVGIGVVLSLVYKN